MKITASSQCMPLPLNTPWGVVPALLPSLPLAACLLVSPLFSVHPPHLCNKYKTSHTTNYRNYLRERERNANIPNVSSGTSVRVAPLCSVDMGLPAPLGCLTCSNVQYTNVQYSNIMYYTHVYIYMVRSLWRWVWTHFVLYEYFPFQFFRRWQRNTWFKLERGDG